MTEHIYMRAVIWSLHDFYYHFANSCYVTVNVLGLKILKCIYVYTNIHFWWNFVSLPFLGLKYMIGYGVLPSIHHIHTVVCTHSTWKARSWLMGELFRRLTVASVAPSLTTICQSHLVVKMLNNSTGNERDKLDIIIEFVAMYAITQDCFQQKQIIN